MQIQKVNHNKTVNTGDREIKQPVKLQSTENCDIVSLSPKAQSHYLSERSQSTDIIHKKIESGWYFRKDTIQKVANAIYHANVL